MFGSVKKGVASSFWRWFSKAAPRIGRNYEAMLAGKLSAALLTEDVDGKLHQYHPGLAFEIGKDANLYDLVLSADGIRGNIEPVLNLVRIAPAIPGWKVTAFRKRMVGGNTKLQIGPDSLDLEKVYFKLEPPRDERCDLKIGFASGSLPADTDLRRPGFLAADLTLGEYDVMTKIGRIDFIWINPASDTSFSPIAELVAIFDSYFPESGN